MDEPSAGFEIAGRKYAVPLVESITIGEERLLYLYADTTIRHLAPPPNALTEEERNAYVREQALRLDSPNFKLAWAMIAYRREHPDADLVEVEKTIDGSNALQLELALIGADADPPVETTSPSEPESKSDGSEPRRSTASGTPSATASENQDKNPVATGHSVSDTSSPESPPIALAS